MYSIKKIKLYDIIGQFQVNKILYECGKDMAKKYDLHHWDNGFIKNTIIIVLCMLKNNIYLIKSHNTVVATFQIKKIEGGAYI